MNKQRYQTGALILISAGFEEESVITCVKNFRSNGLEAKLVGLTAGLTTGIRGLTIRPDMVLADLESYEGYRLVIVPGFTASTQSLLADPRVHRLFAGTTEAGGQVAVMNTAEAAFVQAGMLDLLSGSGVLVQGGQDTVAFIDGLVNLLAT